LSKTTPAKTGPGVRSALAERIAGGRYLDTTARPETAARYGLSQADIQRLIATIIGGDAVAETIQGRERYPVVVRYPRELRDSPEALANLPIIAPGGVQLTLGQVAEIGYSDGPPMLRSDNARLTNYVYVDVADRDLGSVVADLQKAVNEQVQLPAGYSVGWSGQYEFLKRASERLRVVVPATLLIIFGLIFLVFRKLPEALIIMLSLPFALVGGLWLVWLLGHDVSIATLIGFIALAGVAAEFGIIMLLYLRHAWDEQVVRNPNAGLAELDDAIREGAVQRVRPKAMTVAVILAGLFPILIGSGAGSEVMQRIAAPMVGGMLSAPLLSMLVIPAAYRLLQRRRITRAQRTSASAPAHAAGPAP